MFKNKAILIIHGFAGGTYDGDITINGCIASGSANGAQIAGGILGNDNLGNATITNTKSFTNLTGSVTNQFVGSGAGSPNQTFANNYFNSTIATNNGFSTNSIISDFNATNVAVSPVSDNYEQRTYDEIVVNYEGNNYSITLLQSQTVGDMLTQLAAYGVSGYIDNGQLVLSGTNNGYIVSMADNLEIAFGITCGSDEASKN